MWGWLGIRSTRRDSSVNQPAGTAIGFFNLLEPKDLMVRDYVLVSQFFPNSVNLAIEAVPKCRVLFLYCDIEPSGRLAGSVLSLRDAVKESGAQLVVVGSETSMKTLMSPEFGRSIAAEYEGPASIILAINRNEAAFLAFLLQIFQKMLKGSPLTRAWVDLAPQGPPADRVGLGAICFSPRSRSAVADAAQSASFTPLSELLQGSMPNLTKTQATAVANSPVSGIPGTQTWQQLFDETMAKSAHVAAAGQLYYCGKAVLDGREVSTRTLAIEIARATDGKFITFDQTEISQATNAIDFSSYGPALNRTLEKIGYKCG